MDAFDFGNQWHIHSASVSPMTLPVSNQPIACIVSPTGFKRYFMTDIPILPWHHLHAAQVTDAPMPHENVSPHFG